MNGASAGDALKAGLISGAISGGIAAIAVAGFALKNMEGYARVSRGYELLPDGNYVTPSGDAALLDFEDPIMPEGVTGSPLGETGSTGTLGELGTLGKLGENVKLLQNWGWAHDGLCGVLGTGGLAPLSLGTQPLGALMGFFMLPGVAGYLGSDWEYR
ncbi:hypothetical protein [Anaeromyxobacter oryzisoli]|uniref:hypothetical protein n=1 Tax=Anaeromyxobacter oryzisoli TaxID=2925408 RepID=UPI001F574F73|nr:hypothetical protein [Anaeromyxobacter sp. SG63]